MSRSSLYVVIAVLAAAIGAFAIYYVWQQSQEPRLEIQLDGNGLRIEGNE